MSYKSFIESTELGKQPVRWMQAALEADYRGFHPFNLLTIPFQKFFYAEAKQPSFLSNDLIVGNNPIANILLIYKLSKKAEKEDIKKNIAMFMTNQPDYWFYEIIKDPTFFSTINKKTGLDIKNIYDFFSKILLQISQNTKLFLIESENIRIHNAVYDKYNKGWTFHFTLNPPNKDFQLSPYIEHQNSIREVLQKLMHNEMQKKKLIQKVYWKNMTKTNYPVVMSSNVYLSSLPQGWESLGSNIENNAVSFNHYFSDFSYCSAKKIYTDCGDFEKNSMSSIIEILDM